MITRSIRLPDDLLKSIVSVEKAEHIEEAAVIRKLIRIGLESYIGKMYAQGKMTLREAAKVLRLDLSETIDLFQEQGISGNLRAEDVLCSFESMDAL